VNKGYGVVVAALAALIGLYELTAILTPLPTISRIIQGWRDDGHYVAVAVLVGGITLVLLLFAVWVFRHLLFDPRSPMIKF
jgi:hypothetical protein